MARLEIKLQEQMAKNKIRRVTDLRDKTGLSLNLLYSIINGHKDSLRLDTIEKLCRGLNCEISDLIVLNKDGQAQEVS